MFRECAMPYIFLALCPTLSSAFQAAVVQAGMDSEEPTDQVIVQKMLTSDMQGTFACESMQNNSSAASPSGGHSESGALSDDVSAGMKESSRVLPKLPASHVDAYVAEEKTDAVGSRMAEYEITNRGAATQTPAETPPKLFADDETNGVGSWIAAEYELSNHQPIPKLSAAQADLFAADDEAELGLGSWVGGEAELECQSSIAPTKPPPPPKLPAAYADQFAAEDEDTAVGSWIAAEYELSKSETITRTTVLPAPKLSAAYADLFAAEDEADLGSGSWVGGEPELECQIVASVRPTPTLLLEHADFFAAGDEANAVGSWIGAEYALSNSQKNAATPTEPAPKLSAAYADFFAAEDGAHAVGSWTATEYELGRPEPANANPAKPATKLPDAFADAFVVEEYAM